MGRNVSGLHILAGKARVMRLSPVVGAWLVRDKAGVVLVVIRGGSVVGWNYWDWVGLVLAWEWRCVWCGVQGEMWVLV